MQRLRGGCLGNLSLILLIGFMVFLCCEGLSHIYQRNTFLVQGFFHPHLGWLYAPGGRVLLYTEDGWLSHRANADGFLDRNHVREENRQADETRLRIGFFGDEHLEGLDISSGNRFFELLPEKYSHYPLEYFACGITGWGTFAAGLAWRELSSKYKFQQVIYVFSEDDFGDNFRGSSRRLFVPQALETGQFPGFEVDNRFTSMVQKIVASRYSFVTTLKSHSMFFWRLLEFLDVQTERNEYLPEYSLRDKPETNWPAPVTPPLGWPAETENRAGEMMNHLLSTWSEAVQQTGAGFAILTLPARDGQLLASVRPDASWQGWLRTIARQERIAVIDGVRALKRATRAGTIVMQGRNLTPEGHKVLAEEIRVWMEKKFLAAGME